MPNIADMGMEIERLKRGEFRDDLVITDSITAGGAVAVGGALSIVGAVTHDVLQSAEHGAGAIGGGAIGAPQTYRRTEDGVIVKTIKIDITNFLCKGGNAGDAMGLTSLDAYIGRYVIATDGICFRIEMLCVEAPTQTTATITQDIDLGAENDGDVQYDGPVDDVIVNTATLVAGEIAVNNAPALTADDYIYIVEGDTAATTGKYGGGQFIIKFYGHPLLT